MEISNIHSALPGIEKTGIGENERISGGFADYLTKAFGEVNDLLKVADAKSQELATGKSENLHDAMINLEKAETAFKLLVQVRNKAIEAYHEIMRMQV